MSDNVSMKTAPQLASKASVSLGPQVLSIPHPLPSASSAGRAGAGWGRLHFGSQALCTVGGMIIRMGFWEFLIVVIVYYPPKPYSNY